MRSIRSVAQEFISPRDPNRNVKTPCLGVGSAKSGRGFLRNAPKRPRRVLHLRVFECRRKIDKSRGAIPATADPATLRQYSWERLAFARIELRRGAHSAPESDKNFLRRMRVGSGSFARESPISSLAVSSNSPSPSRAPSICRARAMVPHDRFGSPLSKRRTVTGEMPMRSAIEFWEIRRRRRANAKSRPNVSRVRMTGSG